ncbi:MAG: TonB family protein [Candidatus Stahlbacteria bacterium]|nr:MAG: TonB family protein [Candidatus Stahlbacteria bacterium]
MKTLTITLNPRVWVQTLALALRNSFAGLWQTLRNPRLWIGLGSSVLVHGAIFFLSLEYNNKAVAEDPNKIWEVYISPGTEHPKVIKQLIAADPLVTRAGSEDASSHPIRSSVVDQLQAMSKNTIEPTEISAVEPHGVIVLAKHQVSIAEILEREPISDIRSKGGILFPGIVPLEGPIDPTRHTVFEPAVPKPVVEPKPAAPEVKEPKPGQGSKFSLEGELTPADIVSPYLPRYPNFAKAKGLTNVIIIIDFWANQQGDVSPTMVVRRSTGYPNWDEDVKTALARWKFTSSKKLKRTGRITFRFVLD